MPTDDISDYYVMRHRASIAMSVSASEPATRNVHLELARRYAALAGDGGEKMESRIVLSVQTQNIP